ncbi:MAG: MCE family protein [Opitutae bacterium]|nr:MCE family protein [Opitutae bacterium]
MKTKGNNMLVGVFCFGALVLIIGFSIFTGGFSSFRGKNERFVMVFHENVYGLHEGGKVTLNGVRIGRVERFFLGDATEEGPVPVLIEINRKLVQRHMVEEENQLFDLDGFLKSEVVARLQAKLIQESFVTGILYINLTTGVDVNEEKNLYGYREIPTSASIFAELSESINLEKLSKQVSEVMVTSTRKLNDLNVSKLSKDFTVTNNALQGFLEQISSSYSPLGPKLSSATDELKIAIGKINLISDNLKEMFDPTSDFRFGFSNTMRDISAMSKSLKSLADLLERNPQAFLRGKGETSE